MFGPRGGFYGGWRDARLEMLPPNMVAPGWCCDGTAWPRLTHGREASGRNVCFHTLNTGRKHHLVLSF